jgi:hypothetical protein
MRIAPETAFVSSAVGEEIGRVIGSRHAGKIPFERLG